ncbi:YybH family protein [Bauldia sp.]|uniref:YybH family protein n=1 Tax=Bauldia sp. TaxID=2575872 RepID=UPI003BAC2318
MPIRGRLATAAAAAIAGLVKAIGLTMLAVTLLVVAAPSVTEASADEAHASADERAIRDAVDQWIVALNAMLNGDPEPFADIYSHADDAYYMGAEGTYRVGWDAIYADWQAQAAKSTGGTVTAIDVHVMVSGDMAMAAHITRGQVRTPDGSMNENDVRETSVFRKKDGEWRMVGHHADGIPYWEEAFDQ